MRLISHRGNINRVYQERENTPDYIQEAIDLGYDVEIDIWSMGKNNNLYLGHDGPELELNNINWLLNRKDHLWIHCKNFAALSFLINTGLTVFFHEQESYTIISNGYIWAHNLMEIDSKCIIPLLDKDSITNWNPKPVYGVCSDYIEYLND